MLWILCFLLMVRKFLYNLIYLEIFVFVNFIVMVMEDNIKFKYLIDWDGIMMDFLG